MEKLINDKIEILKEANKFNLESITNEEISEFREARIDYLKALNESNDKRFIQKKFEAMLDEIADIFVTTEQWDEPGTVRIGLLKQEEHEYIFNLYSKHRDYIDSVMLYKMSRTELRNLIGYYQKDVK